MVAGKDAETARVNAERLVEPVLGTEVADRAGEVSSVLALGGIGIAFFFFLGQATGPQLLGSILKARGYGAAFIAAGIGLFTTAVVSRMLFARTK